MAFSKTPTVLQMEVTECGAAALAIILAHYGRYVSLEQLRDECGVSRDGTKALNVLKVARNYGLNAVAAQADNLDELIEAPVPFIAYWQFNHFVVVEGIIKDQYYINDPATGRRVIASAEFNKNFTGVLLIFTPTDKFSKGGSRPSVVKIMRERLSGSNICLGYIILATLMLVIPGVIIPGFSKIFIDDILIRGQSDWLIPLLLGMLVTAVLRGLLSWLRNYFLLKINVKLILSGALNFFWQVLKLKVAFFYQRFTGDIISRIEAADRVAELASGQITSAIVSLFSMAFFAVIMLLVAWQLSILVFIVAGINALLLYTVAQKIADTNVKFLQDMGRLFGLEMNGLQNIESIKSCGAESDFFTRWSGVHATTINSQQKLAIYNQALIILPQLLTGLLTVAIIAIGAWQIMRGELTVGTLVAFQSLTTSFLAPIQTLLSLGNQIQQIRGDLMRLDDVLRYPTESKVLPADHELRSNPKGAAVDMNGITFGYSKLDEPLVNDINIKIEPGSRVALVGHSGSGKSTIAKLICGLYEPWQGEICLDNTPIIMIANEIKAKKIAWVDQDIALYEGTVADNLSIFDQNIPHERMLKALAMVGLDEIVLQRGGLLSKVLEGGANYSGGQQQRLEIARALISEPQLLILDEATSALDPLSEKMIYEQVMKLDCTLLIIAHRLSAIRDCDQIMVMEQGKVTDIGSHDELVQKKGLYYQLVTSD